MSRHDYFVSKELDRQGLPFYGILMAAMRKADGANLELLKAGWGDVWEELQARYNAPGGLLPGETESAPLEVKKVLTQRELDQKLIQGVESACEWADFPAACWEWLNEQDTLTAGMRDKLEGMLERANNGEFDRRGG